MEESIIRIFIFCFCIIFGPMLKGLLKIIYTLARGMWFHESIVMKIQGVFASLFLFAIPMMIITTSIENNAPERILGLVIGIIVFNYWNSETTISSFLNNIFSIKKNSNSIKMNQFDKKDSPKKFQIKIPDKKSYTIFEKFGFYLLGALCVIPVLIGIIIDF